MIRRLYEEDDPFCQELLMKKPAENLFIIGDIENFGYEQSFQKLWGEFEESGNLIAILLKYHNNYICYAEKQFNAKEFAEIINQDDDFMQLSGLKDCVDQLLSFVTHEKKRTRTLYYAKCESQNDIPDHWDTTLVKKANMEDIPILAKLHDSIPEFEKDDSREESIRRGMESGSARTYYLENGNRLVSSASTTAENKYSAMIVGVCTHPDHQKHGYASSVMKKLTEDLLREGKMLCLFYDNPSAGTLYKRIGFQDIGKWMMHIYEPSRS
ncbi:GNAT family N-acetyltransferase [Halobacillus fulvus]|nr:GNAT family N-acetyltransferase [Halobacillus fulvus]